MCINKSALSRFTCVTLSPYILYELVSRGALIGLKVIRV